LLCGGRGLRRAMGDPGSPPACPKASMVEPF